jgi:hypothetical protein
MHRLPDKDWKETKARYAAWWNGEDIGRPLFHACVDPGRDMSPKAACLDAECCWLDFASKLDRDERQFSRSAYPAEGYPATAAFLGPGSLAAILGSKPVFDSDTVWYEPCIDDLGTAHLSLELENKWWKWTLDSTRQAVSRGKGSYVAEMPDLIENLDTLASLLGTERLLYSFFDEPGHVHRLQQELLAAWKAAFTEVYNLIREDDGGMSYGGFGIWAPGKFSKLQCDFAAMISGDTYEEFALPYFIDQAGWLDYSCYHLDGPNALQTFDHMLSVRRIGAVQWQPGSMNPKAWDTCWDFIYEKILSAGKSILTLLPVETESDIEKLKDFVRRIGHKRLLVLTEPHPANPGRMEEIVRMSYGW